MRSGRECDDHVVGRSPAQWPPLGWPHQARNATPYRPAARAHNANPRTHLEQHQAEVNQLLAAAVHPQVGADLRA